MLGCSMLLYGTAASYLCTAKYLTLGRLLFNGIVGATGLFTLPVVQLIALVPPGLQGMPFDWRPVVAYGVLANVCYSFGWGLEAVAQRIWGDGCPRFGPALFRQGLAFSVGLTLLPILIVSIAWVARVGLILGSVVR